VKGLHSHPGVTHTDTDAHNRYLALAKSRNFLSLTVQLMALKMFSPRVNLVATGIRAAESPRRTFATRALVRRTRADPRRRSSYAGRIPTRIRAVAAVAGMMLVLVMMAVIVDSCVVSRGRGCRDSHGGGPSGGLMSCHLAKARQGLGFLF